MALFQVSRKMLRAPVGLMRFSTMQAGVGQSAQAHSMPLTIPLPTENAKKDVPNQGWQCDTVVGQSTVPAAGNGRFVKELVKAKTDVIAKRLLPMAEIDTLLNLPNDTTITFTSVEQLEKYISLAKSEGGHSRETVLDLYEHFIYGFDGERACLNVSTWTVNHGDNTGDGLNVDVVEKTLSCGAKAYVGEAMIDIKVGDELYMDYRKFKLPEFYYEYSRKHGFKDVRTATLEAVYGSAE